LGITVANESSATVKNEAVILLYALSSNDASKRDTCDTKNTLAEAIFPPLVYACKSCMYFFSSIQTLLHMLSFPTIQITILTKNRRY